MCFGTVGVHTLCIGIGTYRTVVHMKITMSVYSVYTNQPNLILASSVPGSVPSPRCEVPISMINKVEYHFKPVVLTSYHKMAVHAHVISMLNTNYAANQNNAV